MPVAKILAGYVPFSISNSLKFSRRYPPVVDATTGATTGATGATVTTAFMCSTLWHLYFIAPIIIWRV